MSENTGVCMENGVRFVATLDEREASFRLRYRIYVESMKRLADKADHSRKVLKDEYDDQARSVVAVRDNRVIGTLRLFWGGDKPFCQSLARAYYLAPFLEFLRHDQICIVERLMVCENHRGSTTMLRMYKRVMEFVITHAVEVVLLDCEPKDITSYLKLGFRPFGVTYDYPGIGKVIPMALVVGDYEYLKSVGSPFACLITEQDLNFCHCAADLNAILNKLSNNSSSKADLKALKLSDFLIARQHLFKKRAFPFQHRLSA